MLKRNIDIMSKKIATSASLTKEHKDQALIMAKEFTGNESFSAFCKYAIEKLWREREITMKKLLLITAIATLISCGTTKYPQTERQVKDRIEFLEYQNHTREREIDRLNKKIDELQTRKL